MSGGVAAHHIDWLRLVERSGPFLSLPVLQKVFPQGLDADDRPARSELRVAYEEWKEDSEEEEKLHTRWIEYVLGTLLEYPSHVLLQIDEESPAFSASIPEHHETIVPRWAVVDTDTGEIPRILIQVVPALQSLDKPLPGQVWKSSPATRMAELIRGSGHTSLRLGLVTNGEQWMLVDAAQGQTTAFCSWYASLFFEEPITLRAFRTLLSARRTFRQPDETLEGLLRASADNQQDVTEQLGLQVRLAVEILVHAVDRVDRDGGRELLREFDEQRLYEAACTVMMRLVFLLYAEDSKLMPRGGAVFEEGYAVSPLAEELRTTADVNGPEVLEYSFSAWVRLLATFRALHGGVRHDTWEFLDYRGELFDPDRYPFLEGRTSGTSWLDTPASPLPVDDRIVLHLLEALQLLEVKGAGKNESETRRLSFRELDIEQIGHVYESLLDHKALRVSEPMLGLVGRRGEEPEVYLSELERHSEIGPSSLLTYVLKETKKQKKSAQHCLEADVSGEETRWLASCANDRELFHRVTPYAGLIRDDYRGRPLVWPSGSVLVGAGEERRATGTHYTPRIITEEIVRCALEPLVYNGPSEGSAREQWTLRTGSELLGLKICDMAVGSGAFLVQACRYLSERVVEAWEQTGADEFSIESLNEVERMGLARSLVASRCLYGVDKNPMAVEMAKLSLWLVTLQEDRPFGFLNHALRSGDSLLGVTEVGFLEELSGSVELGDSVKLLKQSVALRSKIASQVAEHGGEADRKAALHLEAEQLLDGLREVSDLQAALEFAGPTTELEELSDLLTSIVAEYGVDRGGMTAGIRDKVGSLVAHNTEMLHWPLAFPEVFQRENPGFDVVIGNPPFQGGQKISGALGADYRDHLVRNVAKGKKGSADLCSYFLLRASSLVRRGGQIGMLTTNTISQGDTREVGLDQVLGGRFDLVRAVASRPWPGVANLEVSQLWLYRGEWQGARFLDGEPTKGITNQLERLSRVSGKANRLKVNKARYYTGSYVLGLGFTMPSAEALELVSKGARYNDVLFPYLNGKELNSTPTHAPARWVINFWDWPLDRETAPSDYVGPVAADYPECLDIVERLVKPDRKSKDGRNATATARALRWWQHAAPSVKLYERLADLDRVLVKSEVGNMLSWAFVPNGWVYSHMLIVYPTDDISVQGLLQSSVHEHWARRYASSMRRDLRYTPSDCFSTFPYPRKLAGIKSTARAYYEARTVFMRERGVGLTKTYNAFHEQREMGPEISRLRDLHTQLDEAVLDAYGWGDLQPDHAFRETKNGIRYSFAKAAVSELLDRLLELNHERYAQEQTKIGL